jgi:hypothetical protein
VSEEGRQAWENMHRRSKGATLTNSSSANFATSNTVLPSHFQSVSAISSNDTFKTFLTSKNEELQLLLEFDDIDLILRVLHASKIKSKNTFSALTSNDLEDIFDEQKTPLHRVIKVSLRAIHKNISQDSHVMMDQSVIISQLQKEVEELKRNSKPSDTTTASDVNISVGGGQALKQSKAQVNSKTSINQVSGVDNIGLQFTHSDKEQIAQLTREMIHMKEEMGIDSTAANLQEEKKKHLEEKDRLFRK